MFDIAQRNDELEEKFSSSFDNSNESKVKRNRDKAKYDAKRDDSDNIAKLLFSKTFNPLEQAKRKADEERKARNEIEESIRRLS